MLQQINPIDISLSYIFLQEDKEHVQKKKKKTFKLIQKFPDQITLPLSYDSNGINYFYNFSNCRIYVFQNDEEAHFEIKFSDNGLVVIEDEKEESKCSRCNSTLNVVKCGKAECIDKDLEFCDICSNEHVCRKPFYVSQYLWLNNYSVIATQSGVFTCWCFLSQAYIYPVYKIFKKYRLTHFE